MCQERKRLIATSSKKTTRKPTARIMSASQIINAWSFIMEINSGTGQIRENTKLTINIRGSRKKPLLEHLVSIVIL